jgi:lysophospholipase L1-like esterase
MPQTSLLSTRTYSLSLRLLALLGSTLLSLVAGLGLYKIVRASASPVNSSNDYILTFVDALDRPLTEKPGTLKLVFDPFLVYRHAPNQRTSSFTIDQHGFRGGITSDKPKIILLGSSAVFGQDLESDNETLARQLDHRYPTHQFVNAGIVGYLAGQELAMMIHRADPLHPVGYILIDGWNEIFDQYHFARRPADRLGFNNAFFDLENRLASLAAARLGKDLTAPPPAELPSPQDSLDQIARTYVSQVERMATFARARGAFFLWCLQPELSAKKHRTHDEQRALAAWNQAYGYIDRGFPQAFEHLARHSVHSAKQVNVEPIILSHHPTLADSTDSLFIDPVHLSARGNALLAEILVPQIRQVLDASPQPPLPQTDHRE